MRCSVCTHPRLAEINVSLCRGMSYRKLSKRYSKGDEGRISIGAVGRHNRHHLPAQLRDRLVARALGGSTEMTLSELKTSESDSLLKNLLANRARYHVIQDRALDAGDLANELAAGAAIDKTLTITGKLIGDLTQHSQTVNNNLFVTPSWFRIRSTIMRALAGPAYRPAREAIAKALLAIEAAPQGEADSKAVVVIEPATVRTVQVVDA